MGNSNQHWWRLILVFVLTGLRTPGKPGRRISGYGCGCFPERIAWGWKTHPEPSEDLGTGLGGRVRRKFWHTTMSLSLHLVLHEEAALLEAPTAVMLGPRKMEASDLNPTEPWTEMTVSSLSGFSHVTWSQQCKSEWHGHHCYFCDEYSPILLREITSFSFLSI